MDGDDEDGDEDVDDPAADLLAVAFHFHHSIPRADLHLSSIFIPTRGGGEIRKCE